MSREYFFLLYSLIWLLLEVTIVCEKSWGLREKFFTVKITVHSLADLKTMNLRSKMSHKGGRSQKSVMYYLNDS
jgi:hypothetical protein